jgi:hypothetical protein
MKSIKRTQLYNVIKKDLKSHDGNILLYKGEYCGGSDRCHGIFEFNYKENPVLKVATGNKSNEEWFGILIHEYCHFLQWRENSKIWRDFEESNFSIDDIIKNPKKFKKEILILIHLELDCERRAVSLIKHYNLFDYKEYIQQANAILYKYGFLYIDGFWPRSNPELKNCHDLCPQKLHKSYMKYLELPEEIYDIYINSQP